MERGPVNFHTYHQPGTTVYRFSGCGTVLGIILFLIVCIVACSYFLARGLEGLFG